ncbi:MAG: hypothetical protein L0211_17580, partial [Planctomycetaceae bacterium]|nr:hypothetical protein [Planctomycetaceae bacterium]
MDRNPHRAKAAQRAGETRQPRASFGWALLAAAIAAFSPTLRAQQPVRPAVVAPIAQPAAGNPAQPLPPPAAAPHAHPDQPLLLQRETLQLAPARLEDFEQTALTNHPQLFAAAQAVDVAEGKAWQARLYPNPVVGYGAP